MRDHLGSHSNRERAARKLYAAWLLHVQQDRILAKNRDGIDGWGAVAAWHALTNDERERWMTMADEFPDVLKRNNIPAEIVQ
jgi:hypothetical protein